MKRFSFPLERVREFRQLQVDIEHSKLQQVLSEVRHLELEVVALGKQLEDEEQSLQESQGQKSEVFPSELVLLDRYRLYILREQKIIAVRQQQLMKQADHQRQKLAEARRNYRLLERLKEKALNKWEYEYNKETEDMVSDLYLARLCQERDAH